MNHECTKAQDIADLHDELYTGRLQRQPLTVRMAGAEAVINKLVYVTTALLISVLVGAGSMVFRSVIITNELKAAITTMQQTVQVVPAPKNMTRN